MNPACWPDVPAMMAELSAEPRVEVMISPYLPVQPILQNDIIEL